MRSLYLSNNKIEDVEVLKGLPKVWTLYLAGNPVKDYTPVGELAWLSSLDLSNCGIEDLSFLKPLDRLKSLILMDNKIKQVTPLLEMARADEKRNFAPFWRIYLKGNPVDPKSEEVQELQSLGARFTFE